MALTTSALSVARPLATSKTNPDSKSVLCSAPGGLPNLAANIEKKPLMTRADGHNLICVPTTNWVSRFRSARGSVSLNVALLIVCLVLASCSEGSRRTEDPRSSVVRLRYDLIAFAKGEVGEVTGKTESEECYILMYGYQAPLDSLPISERLQKRLKAISPRPTEMYVLAHVYGDDVREYTEWELTDEVNDHALLWPMPFIIRGDPFKVTAQERERHKIVIRVE